MKKMVLAIVAVLAMSGSVMAQDEQSQGGRRNRQQPMNQTEMIKQRTDETVKRYGLNEQQAQQLLELNTQYADSMRPMMRGMRGEGPRGGQRGQRMQRPQRPQGGDSTATAPDHHRLPRPEAGRIRGSMEGYEAKLKEIMTEEQFKAYSDDRSRMMNQRRERPHRNDNI